MGVALAVILIRPVMPVVVMALPVRAKAEPVQDLRNHAWPHYRLFVAEAKVVQVASPTTATMSVYGTFRTSHLH